MNFKDFVSNINATCILFVSLIHQEQANFKNAGFLDNVKSSVFVC